MEQTRNKKNLINKLNNIGLFINYIDIKKIELQQELTRKQAQLNQLIILEHAHANLIATVNKKPAKKTKVQPQQRQLLILVDGSYHDQWSQYWYRKLLEDLATVNPQNTIVITFGQNVYQICLNLNLKIVNSYQYQVYENRTQFQELVANLSEIAIKNDLIDKIDLIVCQHDMQTKNLVKMQLYPFVANQLETNSPHQVHSLVTNDYLKFIHDFNYQKSYYYANRNDYLLKNHKIITKEQIGQLNLHDEIAQIKFKIFQYDDKLNELYEEQALVKQQLNRIRRDQMTAACLILHSAFKNNHQDQYGFYQDEDDDWFVGAQQGRSF